MKSIFKTSLTVSSAYVLKYKNIMNHWIDYIKKTHKVNIEKPCRTQWIKQITQFKIVTTHQPKAYSSTN